MMKRILIYSHDTFGLGNIRRMLEIARHLVESSSRVSVLVITGSPMLHAFRIPAGVDTVKLPCLARDVSGRYGARFLSLPLDATVRLRANIIRSTLTDFAPDLILVDKKPFGVEDELAGALGALPVGAARPKLLLLLRDILDSPDATIRIWRKNRYYEAIEAYYDEVLVVGAPEVFDLRLEYAFPPFTAAKVNYCGYIGRQPPRRGRSAVRAELGLTDDQPLVLVTPGGGEDGHALIELALVGLAALPAGRRPRTHIVTGPEMRAPQRAAIDRVAAGLPNVSVQEFTDDMMSMMAAADVVVSMGGYNTVCELLTLGKRAVVVPRTDPVREQAIRAQRLAERDLLRVLEPAGLSGHTLWQAVADELAKRTAHARMTQMPGLPNVSRSVLEALHLPVTAGAKTMLAACRPHAGHPTAAPVAPEQASWAPAGIG